MSKRSTSREFGISGGTNSGVIVGGGNSGTINNVRIVGNPDQPEQPIEVQRMRRLPITTTTVGTVSNLLTVVMFFSGWQTIAQAVDGIRGLTAGSASPGGLPRTPGWTFVFVFTLIGVALGWSLFGFMRRHVYRSLPVSALPGFAGVCYRDGKTRLTAIRLAGRCVKCDARLRFYNKPVEWEYRTDSAGRVAKKVVRREPAAECTRSAEHWYKIDITDNDFDSPVH